jgi:hypothetical protein
MAAAGTMFNWVFVRSGVWTRIWQGPLLQGLPFQGLEFASGSNIAGFVTWTLDGYSAAAPFYERSTGTGPVNASGNPPTGHFLSYAAVLSFRVSPWVEFNILTNRSLWAHIAVF